MDGMVRSNVDTLGSIMLTLELSSFEGWSQCSQHSKECTYDTRARSGSDIDVTQNYHSFPMILISQNLEYLFARNNSDELQVQDHDDRQCHE